MSSHTVPAAAEGMPKDQTVLHAPFYREHVNPADAAFVRTLSVEELFVLYDAASAISEAALGVFNRPTCDGLVAPWVENQMERTSDIRTFIVEELARRPMSGRRTEDERRMGVIISWEFHECGCGAMEAITKLAQMNDAHDTAAFHARRSSQGVADVGR